MNGPLTTYREAAAYLDEMQMHKIKLGLGAMQTILEPLGSPEQSCPSVHVAGTNGKGSVCTMLRTIMSGAGYKTGLYTSPHLSSVRERFRIDDTYISEKDFTRLMERIRASLDGGSITYFECATALAFSWFAEQQCDLIILETGMGGRLDATNVVIPLLSVITTISLDHEQYLGDTLEAVAFEKAGIIKKGIPVITGVSEQGPKAVIARTCTEKTAPLFSRGIDYQLKKENQQRWCWSDTDGNKITDLELPVGGKWQAENSSIAIATAVKLRNSGFTIPDEIIRTGLKNSHWPGRMELIEETGFTRTVQAHGTPSLRFLLDGAHNEAGVASLVDSLKDFYSFRRLLVLWASMGDKTFKPMFNSVARKSDYLVLTCPDPERAASPEQLAAALDETTRHITYVCIKDVGEALETICKKATPEDLIVVAGSLYLIGAVRTLLLGELVE